MRLRKQEISCLDKTSKRLRELAEAACGYSSCIFKIFLYMYNAGYYLAYLAFFKNYASLQLICSYSVYMVTL